MAKSHFAIERPRKISISIEGYNAQAQTLAQKRKQQERRRRISRKAEAAVKRQRVDEPDGAHAAPSGHARARRPQEADEIDALNRAAAAQPLAHDVERELRAALGNGEDLHADE